MLLETQCAVDVIFSKPISPVLGRSNIAPEKIALISYEHFVQAGVEPMQACNTNEKIGHLQENTLWLEMVAAWPQRRS